MFGKFLKITLHLRKRGFKVSLTFQWIRNSGLEGYKYNSMLAPRRWRLEKEELITREGNCNPLWVSWRDLFHSTARAICLSIWANCIRHNPDPIQSKKVPIRAPVSRQVDAMSMVSMSSRNSNTKSNRYSIHIFLQ